LNRASTGTFAIPSYTIFNAALSYNEDKYSLILKLDNITNKNISQAGQPLPHKD
jgi:iron complex outermembrane receptor protein